MMIVIKFKYVEVTNEFSEWKQVGGILLYIKRWNAASTDYPNGK